MNYEILSTTPCAESSTEYVTIRITIEDAVFDQTIVLPVSTAAKRKSAIDAYVASYVEDYGALSA